MLSDSQVCLSEVKVMEHIALGTILLVQLLTVCYCSTRSLSFAD